jgi:hypothetical protein
MSGLLAIVAYYRILSRSVRTALRRRYRSSIVAVVPDIVIIRRINVVSVIPGVIIIRRTSVVSVVITRGCRTLVSQSVVYMF